MMTSDSVCIKVFKQEMYLLCLEFHTQRIPSHSYARQEKKLLGEGIVNLSPALNQTQK